MVRLFLFISFLTQVTKSKKVEQLFVKYSEFIILIISFFINFFLSFVKQAILLLQYSFNIKSINL